MRNNATSQGGQIALKSIISILGEGTEKYLTKTGFGYGLRPNGTGESRVYMAKMGIYWT